MLLAVSTMHDRNKIAHVPPTCCSHMLQPAYCSPHAVAQVQPRCSRHCNQLARLPTGRVEQYQLWLQDSYNMHS